MSAQCPTPITFSLNSTAPTCSTCCDGSLTVANIQNGCPGYNIQLNPSSPMTTFGTFINLCAGSNYTVTVIDNGCCGGSSMICSMNYSQTTSCTIPVTYSLQVTPPTCSVCCDGSVQVVNLSGGCSAPYTGQWNDGSSGLIKNNLCSGNYSVTVMDSQAGSCCPNVTQGCFVPLGGTTSISENSLDNHLSIYPNPTNSVLNIVDTQNQFQNGIIEIKNYLGQVILSTPFNSQINISVLSEGMYFFNIKDNTHRRAIKILKQ